MFAVARLPAVAVELKRGSGSDDGTCAQCQVLSPWRNSTNLPLYKNRLVMLRHDAAVYETVMAPKG